LVLGKQYAYVVLGSILTIILFEILLSRNCSFRNADVRFYLQFPHNRRQGLEKSL